MSEIPEELQKFFEFPAKVLSVSSRTWLAKRLNPELDTISETHCLVKDWRGVAEFLEYPSLDIDNFARDKNPTAELLRQWSFLETSKIRKLLEALEAVERFDVLCDAQLVNILDRDCVAYQRSIEAQLQDSSGEENQPLQVDEVTSVDNEYISITVNEVMTGVPEYFDAFVCYTNQDFEFVRQMMHKLETVNGLKLCIVSRDLMPGCAKYVIMAKLIQERCRKMIIVLSPDYIDSKECAFQTRFAHSLAPGAKEKKLIPVIYRPCPIPPILNHICTVDYTRCDVVDWFWTRLANSLKKAQGDPAIMETRSFTETASTVPHVPHVPVNSNLVTTEYRLPTSSHTRALGNVQPDVIAHSQKLDTRVAAVQAHEAAGMSRTSSANSLSETSSNKSWTEVNATEDLMDADFQNSQSSTASFEMQESQTVRTKTKFLTKILQPFKKHP